MKRNLVGLLPFVFAALTAAQPVDVIDRGDLETIYPLSVGARWHYVVEGEDGFRFEVEMKAPGELAGRFVIPRVMDIDGQEYVTFLELTDDALFDVGSLNPGSAEPEMRPAPLAFLRFPLTPGRSWTVESELNLIREGVPMDLELAVESYSEEVTVAAGTFQGCIKIAGRGEVFVEMDGGRRARVEVEKANWYARGVGIVRTVVRETSDDPELGEHEMVIDLERWEPAESEAQ